MGLLSLFQSTDAIARCSETSPDFTLHAVPTCIRTQVPPPDTILIWVLLVKAKQYHSDGLH